MIYQRQVNLEYYPYFSDKEAKIVVNDGTWFGSQKYKGYIRFNFATNKKKY